MTLREARVALNASETATLDIVIEHGKITALGPRIASSAPQINLEGFVVLPGLINSHDHLELNLFPRLGRGPYPNASEWAKDIYHPGEPPIRQHLQVPKRVRLLWGGIKNLVCGVTTVAHHNPYDPHVFENNFPVRVVRQYGWAHSLQYSPRLFTAFHQTPTAFPFLVHAGEGTDELSRQELYRLDATGVLNPRTILIHGVSVGPRELMLLRSRGISLVWCPSSNLFTLHRTLSPVVLDSSIPIALGTDSALTAGDLIDEISMARRSRTPERLYEMVTSSAASILRLGQGEGEIGEGSVADLVVVRNWGQTPAEALLDLWPEMVFVGGRIKLISRKASAELRIVPPGFQPLHIEGRGEWLIDADVPNLLHAAKKALQEAVRLAGRKVAA
jgi:cytosine/adenosine deaminase-related metal-dependent hydrolase